MQKLNDRAMVLCRELDTSAHLLKIATDPTSDQRIWDFGIKTPSSLRAGIRLAEICMSGLADIRIQPGVAGWPGPAVSVLVDDPVRACMASQYAGWQLQTDDYFAMGSGPMRAANGTEEIFDAIGYRETVDQVVGVLESGRTPTESAIAAVASACDVSPQNVTLLVAPTSSQAGNVQIVARSVETALHKLHELGFDLSRIESGYGIAPLPPVAKDDLSGIGRTNDAILYGGSVSLWVRGDDDSLDDISTKLPSNASHDFGRPFREIFDAYNHDFYKIDKKLFSPAQIVLCNLDTGRSFLAGEIYPDLIEKSFLT